MVSNIATLKTGTQPVILSLDDAKSHLNITHSYQDELIQSYIDVAESEAENYTSRSLKNYEVTLTTTIFHDQLLLTMTPYQGNLVIKYYDVNNVLQILSEETYVLGYHFGEPVIYFNDPTALPILYSRKDAVVITFDSGYGIQIMPKQFTQFCKLVVGTLYEHRTDSVDKLPRLSYNLIHKFKLQWQ